MSAHAPNRYICDHYDPGNKVLPSAATHAALRARTQTFVHAAEATFALHSLAILYARWNYPAALKESHPAGLEAMEASLKDNVRNDLNWLEEELGNSTGRFLVGNQVTAADCMMAFSIAFIFERDLGVKGLKRGKDGNGRGGEDLGRWKKIEEWLDRCESTNSYKRAVERSGHTWYPAQT